MLKIKNLLITFFVFSALISFGQQNTQSPYSRFGVGDLERFTTSQNAAMGGISAGLRSYNHLNIENPASYSALLPSTVIFEIGARARFTNYSTSDATSTGRISNLAYMAAGIGIKKWWGTTIGLIPYSAMEYKDSSYQILKDNAYNISYVGKGGINRFFWGNSFKVNKISAGVTLNYFFGNIDKTSNTQLVTNEFTSVVSNENKILVSNFGFSTGIQYTDTIKKDFIITGGIIFDNQTKLTAEETRYVSQYVAMSGLGLGDTVFYNQINKGTITLPSRICVGVGLAYKQFVVGVDYTMQDWSKDNYSGLSGVFANSSSLSAGLEYCANRTSPKFFNALRYRCGGYYSNSYLKIGSEQIKDMGVTVGLGIPLKNTGTIINLALQYGQRGTKDLLKENNVQVLFNMSLFDLWFIKRKFD